MADLSRFSEAKAEVQHSPHAVSAWEEAEGLAAELDKPDDIVALYGEALAGQLEPQVAEMIGERAGSFCDEWFGDDPKVGRRRQPGAAEPERHEPGADLHAEHRQRPGAVPQGRRRHVLAARDPADRAGERAARRDR